MVVVNCSVPECDFSTEDVSEALAIIALLTNHGIAHTAPTTSPPVRGPKLERPQINVGVSTEEWNVFVRRWEVFRKGSGVDNASGFGFISTKENLLLRAVSKASTLRSAVFMVPMM